MFATCMHCNAALGSNESIEAFPVGRRIAFDARGGRLWAICRSCERWNLSPIEERWDAVEQCERTFRATRVRVSTDNIGLARLADGTELVRIGAPQRPEFAAWRYGDQFGRRRRRLWTYGAASVAGAGAIVAGGLALGVSIMAVAPLINVLNIVNIARMADATSRTRLSLPDGNYFRPFGNPRLQVRRDVPEGWGISIGYAERGAGDETDTPPHFGWAALRRWQSQHNKMALGDIHLRGNDAESVLRWAMPRVNSRGATSRVVADSVRLIEAAGASDRFGSWAASQLPKWNGQMTFGDNGDVSQIPQTARLAFEMTLNEESERQALAGELSKLEAAWREADAVAKIADGLLPMPTIDARIAAMHIEPRNHE